MFSKILFSIICFQKNLFSIICDKWGSEDEKIFKKDETNEELEILGLVRNI